MIVYLHKTSPLNFFSMKNNKPRFFCALLAFLILLNVSIASAQQTTGTPGSPSATTTISGKQLPAPDPPFGGDIKDGALQSKAWWAPRIVTPKGAPNILLVLVDDAGYGVAGTFGGVIPTPTLDRLARSGLRYTQFHSCLLYTSDAADE